MAETVFDRLKTDWRFYTRLLRASALNFTRDPEAAFTITDYMAPGFATDPATPAVIFEGKTTTFGDLDALANRYGRWAREQGLSEGGCVALMMENCPAFLAAVLGFARAGLRTALINTNLSGDALAHSLSAVEAGIFVAGENRAEVALEFLRTHAPSIPVFVEGPSAPGAEPLEASLNAASDAPIPADWRQAGRPNDRVLHIYTSGTTGLPKAANLTHYRVAQAMHFFTMVTGIKPGGRHYTVLPLYHGNGLYASLTSLQQGASVVLRRKFSASAFWRDCVENEVTAFVYIGELMRYLVNAPETADDRRHKVASCGGNGLRPDVWPTFVERFGIEDIVEFYGATEGNVAIVNLDNTPGAVGRVPPIVRRRLGFEIVRFDDATQAPARNAQGRCTRCDVGEIGEAISRIDTTSKARYRYEGYTDGQATNKKVLRDVFEVGDMYFRTGDLMRREKRDYIYFVDRIGDTFRWKGENVATTEVQEALSRFQGVVEAIVYGVAVPGADGRAGMAALVTDESFDIAGLGAHVCGHLPAYARPLFVRLVGQATTTGTFKYRKSDLQAQGFDPLNVDGGVYFLTQSGYDLMDSATHAGLLAGTVRL
ncbi:MAG: long-chain-acyl-CoA synthetase [Pseudomonadota bacterium]